MFHYQGLIVKNLPSTWGRFNFKGQESLRTTTHVLHAYQQDRETFQRLQLNVLYSPAQKEKKMKEKRAG